jgi:hypothetical protein
MRLEWLSGTPLFCRRCQAEVPHYKYRYHTVLVEALRDAAGHVQSPLNAMLSLSVEEETDPAVMLLPRRSWSAAYVQRRYQLLSTWKSWNKGT